MCYCFVMKTNSDFSSVERAAILRNAAEIAAFLNVRERVIGQWAKQEGLPVVKIGKCWMSTTRAILRWIEQRAEAERAGP